MENAQEGLIYKMSKGSIEAFDQFYELHSPYVYGIALKMARNASEAEDLCHDVFVEVFRSAEQFDPSRGSVRAWLAIKTKSRYLDRQRKVKRSRDYLDRVESIDQEPATDELVLRQIDREQVLSALKELPESQKKAVYGKYFNYQTQKELAAHLDKPIGTIKSLLRYGLNNLRKELIKLGWSPLSGGDHRRER
ncbi:RNA polymerase sigma-70 factor (ECF subfamily) [Pullulanibacillus pueri]|nr:sigma-70 family RNA polymerase sigma factor [Pullulanibacillus pueri]MBM7680516.1 RNA polymerase sigma-70 factor (ECF subfamily) [Pullulanibacillus pueri]